MHNLLQWCLCVYDNPMPPLYNQINFQSVLLLSFFSQNSLWTLKTVSPLLKGWT